MIPKIIHYCWFGCNPKPDLIQRCIESWKKHCPDYEIIEWNETNFDVHAIPYMSDAYEAKKWAFVSDVARLMILYQHGGIYLDTDVEITVDNPFNELLEFENLLVFENERGINSGLCYACEKGSLLCNELLKAYWNIHFPGNKPLLNTQMNKPIFVALYPGLKWNGQKQTFGKTCFLGVAEYLKIMQHYGTKTWCDDIPEYSLSGESWLKKALRNPNIFEHLEKSSVGKKLIPLYEFLSYDLLDLGPFYFIKRKWLQLKGHHK